MRDIRWINSNVVNVVIVEDADVNAAFVIALRHKGILQSPIDRDIGEGSTDTPKKATTKKAG